nr:MAG TPA: hypothetical protein [Caudoviricetes sp.]
MLRQSTTAWPLMERRFSIFLAVLLYRHFMRLSSKNTVIMRF